jgi:hypothetical protein
MKQIKIIYLMTFAAFLACKAQAQPERPLENYDVITSEPQASIVNIPVNIGADELERTINAKTNNMIFYEDYDYNNEGGDNIMMKIMKSNVINVWFEGNYMYYRVPVSLWIKKNLVVSELEANGEIALKFKSFFKLKEDWSIETYTNVESYDWIKQPVLKVGFDMPVTSIANTVLDRNKTLIAGIIDKQVRENLNMRQNIQDTWNTMQTPIKLNDEYKTWVKITPKSISLSPISTANNSIATNISVSAITEVHIGSAPAFRTNTFLPNFSYGGQNTNDFSVTVSTDVPFTEAEEMAKLKMVGQTFGDASKQVKVENLELFGQGDKMVINTTLSGAYNGQVYLVGKPLYDPVTKSITMDNLDFELKTKNFLAKSANFLFHKTLVNKMKDSMKIPLEQQLTEMKNMISSSLTNYVVTKGITMNGTVDHLDIQKIYLTQNGIKIEVLSNGALNLMVKGLE